MCADCQYFGLGVNVFYISGVGTPHSVIFRPHKTLLCTIHLSLMGRTQMVHPRNDAIGNDAWKEDKNRLSGIIDKRLIADLKSIEAEVQLVGNTEDCGIVRDKFKAWVERMNRKLEGLYKKPFDSDLPWQETVVREITGAIMRQYDVYDE
jgi:hypothetical protein